jgi:hypothetical protein
MWSQTFPVFEDVHPNVLGLTVLNRDHWATGDRETGTVAFTVRGGHIDGGDVLFTVVFEEPFIFAPSVVRLAKGANMFEGTFYTGTITRQGFTVRHTSELPPSALFYTCDYEAFLG